MALCVVIKSGDPCETNETKKPIHTLLQNQKSSHF